MFTRFFRSAFLLTKPHNFPKFKPIPTFFSSISAPDEARRPLFPTIPPPDKADRSELLRSLEFALKTSFRANPLIRNPNPLILVITGRNGVGKDSVIKRLTEIREGLHFVVAATSRPIRPGEIDGEDYHFVSEKDFRAMIERNELLEHALVCGDYEGIPKRRIRELLAKGCDVVLRVDIEVALTLRKILGNSAVFVFLMEGEKVKHVSGFDYVVVNAEGKLEDAVKLVESIIDAEKAKVFQRQAYV